MTNNKTSSSGNQSVCKITEWNQSKEKFGPFVSLLLFASQMMIKKVFTLLEKNHQKTFSHAKQCKILNILNKLIQANKCFHLSWFSEYTLLQTHIIFYVHIND